MTDIQKSRRKMLFYRNFHRKYDFDKVVLNSLGSRHSSRQVVHFRALRIFKTLIFNNLIFTRCNHK